LPSVTGPIVGSITGSIIGIPGISGISFDNEIYGPWGLQTVPGQKPCAYAARHAARCQGRIVTGPRDG